MAFNNLKQLPENILWSKSYDMAKSRIRYRGGGNLLTTKTNKKGLIHVVTRLCVWLHVSERGEEGYVSELRLLPWSHPLCLGTGVLD